MPIRPLPRRTVAQLDTPRSAPEPARLRRACAVLPHRSARGSALRWALASMVIVAAFPALAQTRLDQPVGGWRHGAADVAGFRQEVNYPASSVNAAGHGALALIRGRVAGAPKSPATLVVNGVAMPLALDPSGVYERPYAFGAGSNAIEVRAPGEKVGRRAQFYESNASRPQARLRIVLSWDTSGTDLDLHVVAPDGQHTWYGNRVSPSGGALDIDVTTGYGPEIFAHPAPVAGTYHVFVNYFGAGVDLARAPITVAQIAVVTGEGTPAETQRVFRVPMRRAGELTRVAAFGVR